MLDKNTQLLIAAGSLLAAANVLRHAIHTHRIEAKKREVIQKNHDLNIAALDKAHETMLKRIREGCYDNSWKNLMNDYKREIEFEKIAIRLK